MPVDPNERADHRLERAQPALWLILAAVTGLITTIVAMQLGAMSRRTMLFAFGGIGLIWFAFATKHPKEVLLFFWTAALTYNRNYFSFEPLFGDQGSQGLYWIPADALFALLLAGWVYESSIRKKPLVPIGPPLWRIYLPFFAIAFISSLAAANPGWALADMARLLKVGVIFLYVRYNVGRTQFWACLAGAAFMILAQSAYGVLQVASRGSFEISALLGAGPGAALREFQSDLQQEWHRARGTLGHPNILAPWLMLLAPAFLAMSTVIRDRALQLVCFTVGAVGLVGVAFTLSRAAWAVAFVQMCILAAALTWMGALKARQTLGIAVVVGLAGVLATAPFIDTLVERVTRDFVASVDFRAEYNEDALAIFMKSPAIGVGPNNFVHYLPEYDPTINDFLEEANTVRKLVNIRVIAAVHNMYLLLLAEIGILGIAAFFVFIAGALHRGMRAVANTSGPLQMASLGLTIGILGVMGVQFTEFSLWVDPVLYTFALTVALLNNAPGIQAAQAAPESVDV